MSLISFNFARRKPTLPEIQPCFCNGGDFDLVQVQGGHRVVCRYCGKEGPVDETKEGAIRWWNHVNK